MSVPYNNRAIITDKDKKPVPQYYNPKTDAYEPIEGEYGANSFLQKGTVIKKMWEGSSDGTMIFSEPMYGFGIINDGTSDLTFTINNQMVTVKVGEAFQDLFEPFTKIDIATKSPYRALVRV